MLLHLDSNALTESPNQWMRFDEPDGVGLVAHQAALCSAAGADSSVIRS